MRKAIFAALLLFVNVFATVHTAHAESLTASNIFESFKGTTTIDEGGVLHSQARSIYSLGGGMTSFKGKKISLIAADPPGFSAGCSGISWHFGGFAFISVDEIRQLVEAVSQASLGIAVDLAMQTLCPQCYAVMSKLRDMSNQMRNAAMDSCQIASNFGKMLTDKGIFSAEGASQKCGAYNSAEGKEASYMNAVAGGACGLLDDAQNSMKEMGQGIEDFFRKGNTAGKTSPDAAELAEVGNRTYKMLSALGYKDGFAKDFLMSYLGMHIVTAVPTENCTQVFANFKGSANSMLNPSQQKVVDSGVLVKDEIAPKDTEEITVADGTTTPSSVNPSGSKVSRQHCYMPPLLTGVSSLGMQLLCGVTPDTDMGTFANKFHNGKLAGVHNSTLGAMCRTYAIEKNQAGNEWRQGENLYLYTCRSTPDEGPTAECMFPQMVSMQELMVPSGGPNEYSGLAWMILDALYAGVSTIAEGTKRLPEETIGVLNGSGYPLYRLLNMAAVYPGMADEMLQAYGASISIQYVMDTIERVTRVGAMPTGDTKAVSVPPGEIAQMRSEIANLYTRIDAIKDQTFRRMNEKRAIVDSIIQVNRALQSEVISRGLGDNNNMALTLKKQAATK